MTLPAKRKPGRPKDTPERIEAREATRAAKARERVVTKQRGDIDRLRADIKAARSNEPPDSAAVSRLARATQILHSLENDSFDMGGQGKQVNAVIVIPALAGSMEAWNKQAATLFPPIKDESLRVYPVEDDIQGEAPEGEAGD